MNDIPQVQRSTTLFVLPGGTLVLTMLLWLFLNLNEAAPAIFVRVLMLATPIAAIGCLLQSFGLFVSADAPPELKSRLILLDVAVLLMFGGVLAGGVFLFPDEFDWLRSCSIGY